MFTRKFLKSSLALAGVSLAALVAAQTEKPASAPAKVGPFEVAPHWSRYAFPKSIGEGQAYHIVVSGDTLWDIAGRYLGNPYLWPQIWEANGYVKKARLIYPGDPIFLPSVQMAGAAGAAGAATETGEAEGETAVKAMGPVPIPEWMNMDALINVASADTVRYSGYISASVEDESLKIKGMESEGGSPIERVTVATHDYLYLDRGTGAGIKAGDLYTVHRRARTIKHPATGKRVGYRVDTVGVVRIVLVGETTSRAVVESAGREIKVGDYLRPFADVESPLVKRRVVVDGGDLSLDSDSRAHGYVVDVADNMIASASGLVVGVDVGAGSGLTVGKVVTVFRQGKKQDAVRRRPLGAAVIVAVRENFSVARLVYSREEILVGDRVVVQP